MIFQQINKKINEISSFCNIILTGILLFIVIFQLGSIFINVNTEVDSKIYLTQLTHYYTGDSTGTGTYLPGLKKNINELGDLAQVNEYGWYFYNKNGTQYLMVATATEQCLGVTTPTDACYKYHLAGRIAGINYRNYGDTFLLKIDGVTYNAMVVDSCGGCMRASTVGNEKIDILTVPNLTKKPDALAASVVGDTTSVNYNPSILQNVDSNINISYNPGTTYVGTIQNGFLYKRFEKELVDYDKTSTESLEKDYELVVTSIYNRVVGGLLYHNNLLTNEIFPGNGQGLSSADPTGFKKRVSQPTMIDNNAKFYFTNRNSSFAGGYLGQCTWYAFGRANEILSTVGSNLKWTIASDAGTWYDYNLKKGTLGFKSSNDYTKPKVGAIISWKKTGAAGHVAVIEAVNGDGTVDITEANISTEKSYTNPYGWRYKTVTLGYIKSHGNYRFSGYIYMLD